jgi:hypothetical protein
MAAAKPEVLLSRLADQIEGRFQRTGHVFVSSNPNELLGILRDQIGSGKSNMAGFWRPLNRKYLYLSFQTR